MEKYFCSVCGYEVNNKRQLRNGMCSKHYHQVLKYGKPQDSNMRRISDMNEIVDKDNYSEIILYDKFSNEINRAKIDKDMREKIANLKWRISTKKKKHYVVTGQKDTMIYLHQIVIKAFVESDKFNEYSMKNTYLEIDHINGDPLDNRVSNLRIINKTDNAKNSNIRTDNTSGFRGVTKLTDHSNGKIKYRAEIQSDLKKYSFKEVSNFYEAVYIRILAEKMLHKEFSSSDGHISLNLTDSIKNTLQEYVSQKLSE